MEREQKVAINNTYVDHKPETGIQIHIMDGTNLTKVNVHSCWSLVYVLCWASHVLTVFVSATDYPEMGTARGETGDYGDDDEDEYEDPEEMIREFGRHPMMDRVQEALYNQLLQTYERVSEELRDTDADVKK